MEYLIKLVIFVIFGCGLQETFEAIKTSIY